MNKTLLVFALLLCLITSVSANINTPLPPAFNCNGRTCNIANTGTLDGFDLDQDVTFRASPEFDIITSGDGGTESILISGGIGKIEALVSTLTLKSSAGLGIFLQSGDHVSVIVAAGKSLQPFTNGNIDLGRNTATWQNLYLSGFISDGTNNYSLPDLNKGTWPIQDANIDFGTGAGQVSALDIPIADANDFFVGTTVEAALQDAGLDLNTLNNFFNGTIDESFNAFVTSDGAIVTMSLTGACSDNLTMNFTDGKTFLDVSPAATIVLTAGSDASPTENFISIPFSTKVLTKSTSDWPTEQHIRIGYFFVPSAGFVQTNGVYINQNWNEDKQGCDGQGDDSHIGERFRRLGASYFTGVDGSGTDGYLTPTALNTRLSSTSGIVYQKYAHLISSFDTIDGNMILVKNWSGDAFHDTNNLFDITADSTGASIGNNKYFNLTIWKVANKTNQFVPTIINLPSGFYNSQSDAENDVSGFDDFTMPAEFNTESSTGFLVARVTIKMKTAGTWVVTKTVDLRGTSPQTASGTAAGIQVNFSDNQFTVFDESDVTKIMAFDVGTNIATGNTRTLQVPNADGILALTAQTDGTINASDVTAGTFGTGNYIIDSKLAVGGTKLDTQFSFGSSFFQDIGANAIWSNVIFFNGTNFEYSNTGGGGFHFMSPTGIYGYYVIEAGVDGNVLADLPTPAIAIATDSSVAYKESITIGDATIGESYALGFNDEDGLGLWTYDGANGWFSTNGDRVLFGGTGAGTGFLFSNFTFQQVSATTLAINSSGTQVISSTGSTTGDWWTMRNNNAAGDILVLLGAGGSLQHQFFSNGNVLHGGSAMTLGDSAQSVITVNFDTSGNDGTYLWSSIADQFQFSDDILMTTTENIYFRDTGIHINSGADGVMNIVADINITLGAASTNYINVTGTGDQTFVGSAGFYPRRISQSTEPANGTGSTQIDVGEVAIWRDSVVDAIWLIYNDTDAGIVKVQLT